MLNILVAAMEASGTTSLKGELDRFYKHNPSASAAAIADVRERYDHDAMVYRDPILSQVTGVFADAPYVNNLLYLIANDLERGRLSRRLQNQL